MVDLFLLGIGLGIRLADALGDNTRVALRVASILAVLALHTGRVLEEVTTESTAHDVVKLPLHKLVAVNIVNLLLPLTNGTLSAQTGAHFSFVVRRFDEVQAQLYLAGGLQVEPAVYRLRDLDLGLRRRVGWLRTLVSWRGWRRSKLRLALLLSIQGELWRGSSSGVGHPIS